MGLLVNGCYIFICWEVLNLKDLDLKHAIEGLIRTKREDDYWDFKEKHHINKADLLHDIICMANNRVDRDAYIIR